MGECVGSFEVTVVREGGDPNTMVLVDYKTEDGTANAGGDYVAAEGTLVFLPGETTKVFNLEVIDDDAFEEDEHGGIFQVAEKDIDIMETVGVYECKITRWSGARGRVSIPYHTEDGTAKAGKDYEHVEGELIFENNETDKYIE